MAELLLEEPDGRLDRVATIVGCRPSALPAEGPEVHDALLWYTMLSTMLRPDDRRPQGGREARWRSAGYADQMQAETLRRQSRMQQQCLSSETTCDW